MNQSSALHPPSPNARDLGRRGRSAHALMRFMTPGAAAFCVAVTPVAAAPMTLAFEAAPLMVASTNASTGGGMTTAAGVEAFGVDLGGVGRLSVDNHPAVGRGSAGSASLLWTGRHILTAAHCVTNLDGEIDVIDGGDGNRITFHTTAGAMVTSFAAGQVDVHPLFGGEASDGYDLAIITLPTALDPSVTRYGINTAAGAEFGVSHVAAGWGRSGHGSTGALLDGGTLRAGLNDFEDDGLGTRGVDGRPSTLSMTNNQTQLTADFDSGFAWNDAFGDLSLGPRHIGRGDDEIGIAAGDSGGPSFIFMDGTPVIAGVHSYNLRVFAGSRSPDVDEELNSSWGEFYVDARVADPLVLDWIASVVPEPATLLLMAGALPALLTRRRMR